MLCQNKSLVGSGLYVKFLFADGEKDNERSKVREINTHAMFVFYTLLNTILQYSVPAIPMPPVITDQP